MTLGGLASPGTNTLAFFGAQAAITDTNVLGTANVMMAKDGVVHTPTANGTFLAGITRRRVIQLLRDAGKDVRERSITYEELLGADELFSVGNYGKVLPITRIEQRHLQPGPVYARARELYWDFAHST